MVKVKKVVIAASVMIVGLASNALAQDASSNTADEALPSICTDRPTKSAFACTVEPGHFQYESDLLNFATSSSNGVTTDTWMIMNPTIKYGLTPKIDVEANLSPFVSINVHNQSSAHSTETGISDLYLKMKYEFANVDDGGLQIALLPYIKLPTAKHGIGNGAVEGGALIPLNYKLTDSITLTTAPELDVLVNEAGGGRHVSTTQLINLGFALPGGWTLYGELWENWNFDPISTTRQFSADTAIAYSVSQHLQLDIGLNAGLNTNTPRLQGYVGISQKF